MFCVLALKEHVDYSIHLLGGDTVSLGEIGRMVRELVPSAEITFQPRGKEIPLIYLIDSSRFENEFKFKRTALIDGVKKHMNEARDAAGLKPFEWGIRG